MLVFQEKELQSQSCSRRSQRLAAGAIALSLSVVGFGLTACGNDGAVSGSASDDGPIKVVASTTQICDYVTQLQVPKIDLTCLLAPNASAHELEMTHEQMTKTSEADLLLVNGVDLEHFLDSAVESSGFSGTMVVTSGILTAADVDSAATSGASSAKPEKAANGNYTIDRGIEKVDVAPWPFPPENPGEQPEFRFDPHVWTSPKNAKVQVANIGNALEQVAADRGDKALKSDIAKHVDSYETKLDKLDVWAHESINSVKKPVLFTSHDAFGYFSKEFDINFIGAALSDFNSQQDATAEHIAAAVKTVKESGATALFAENSNNAKSIEAIAKAAGVKAIVGDDALYGDSLGPAGSTGATYIDSIIHNVTTVVKAWHGAVADLPQGIK